MNKSVSLLGALGVGAGLMYLLDPDRGKRRRAILRDQTKHFTNTANRRMGKVASDLKNRTRGVVAETKSIISREEISDEKLNARIRSKIGRLTTHPHALKTQVENGKVIISGQILSDEADDLVKGIEKMRGVNEIETHLELHNASEKLPALSPNYRTHLKNGISHSWRTPNLPRRIRVLSTAAGLGLGYLAMKKRGILGTTAGGAGAELLSLGLANKFIENIGTNGGKGIDVKKTITIAAPPVKVYEICSRPENFPLFMSHVKEVKKIGDNQYQWKVDSLAGMPMVWKTKVVESRPNELIRWEHADDELVAQRGAMRFERTEDNHTRLHVEMQYHPPGGALAHALAYIFRRDPKTEMDDDLLRMKSYIEKGKPARDAVAEIQKRKSRKMKLRDIMTPDPVCCEPGDSLQEVAQLMAQQDCGAIPIVENWTTKKPVGIVTDRDITVRAITSGKNPLEMSAGEIMTTNVLTVNQDSSLDECCHLMEKNQVRRMLVVDKNGACVGIVAQADVARKAPEYETAELVRDVSKSHGMQSIFSQI
jgi:uncharacterized membrane protein/CBS domain-containing protein